MKTTLAPPVAGRHRAYRLVPFGPGAAASSRDLARLHATLLPQSPIALLGRRFMERFYYHVLPAEGLIVGAVAYVDDAPAGFAVATADSNGFMRTAVRRRWPRLMWVLGTSALLNPACVAPMRKAVGVMRQRRSVAPGDRTGEILSMGILPEYRNPKFMLESGLRISTDLVDHVVARLGEAGVRVIRAVVAGDNTQAKLLYCGLGWTLNRTDVPEWTTPTAEFVWRA